MIEETSKDSNCSMNRSSKKALIMLMSGKSHKLDRRKEACVVRAAMEMMVIKVFRGLLALTVWLQSGGELCHSTRLIMG